MPATELDHFEYPTATAAQATYLTNSSYYDSATELVTNGTAWTGATGTTPPDNWAKWTVGTDPTYTVSSGELQITRGTQNCGCSQMITTVVGNRYIISGDLKNGNLTQVAFIAGTAPASNSYLSAQNSYNSGTSWVNRVCYFTATTTTTYITIIVQGSSAGQYGYFDNISLKERVYYLQCYSEPTIKIQGNYSLKVIALTGSNGNTLTRSF